MTSEITDVDDEVMTDDDEDTLATKLEDSVVENIQEPVKQDKPESPSKLDEPLTASARVAAMLAGPVAPAETANDEYEAASPLPPPPPSPLAVPFQLPITAPEFFPNTDLSPMLDEIPDDAFITDMSPLPTPPPTPPPSEIPSVIPDPVTPPTQPSMTNGNGVKKNIVLTSTPLAKQMLMMNQQKPIKPSAIPTPTRPAYSTAIPAAATTVTPSRIPKLASGSSLPAAVHPKVVKTPSGGKMNGKTPIPSSAGKGNVGSRSTPMSNGTSGNGRIVLRTRRQVAQELEDQQRNGFDKSGNEENEDCGRLI